MSAPLYLRTWQQEPSDGDLFWLCGVGRDRGVGKSFAGALATSARIDAGLTVLLIGKTNEHLRQMVEPHEGLMKFIRTKPERMNPREEIVWPGGGRAILRTLDQVLERVPQFEFAAAWGDDLVGWDTGPTKYEAIRRMLRALARQVTFSDHPKIILSGELACPVFMPDDHDHLPADFSERLAASRPG